MLKTNQHEITEQEITPSKVPLFLHIDPVNLCNFKCTFCPTGDHDLLEIIGRPKGMMSPLTFEKIIGDLELMVAKYGTKPIEIDLFKDGEPLLNKNLAKMVHIISEKKLADNIGITTNASILTPKRSRELITSGLQKIKFSIEHINDDGYHKVTQTRVPFNKIYSNIKEFWNINLDLGSPVKIHSKIVNINYSYEMIKEFKKIFSPISHSVSIDKIHGWSASSKKDWQLGINNTIPDEDSSCRSNQVCHQPFNLLTILFNGDLTPCCVDWTHRLVIGNIHDSSLDELWNGSEINKQRTDQILQRISPSSPCFDCSYRLGSSLSIGRKTDIKADLDDDLRMTE